MLFIALIAACVVLAALAAATLRAGDVVFFPQPVQIGGTRNLYRA
jgi:hypothetical protein